MVWQAAVALVPLARWGRATLMKGSVEFSTALNKIFLFVRVANRKMAADPRLAKLQDEFPGWDGKVPLEEVAGWTDEEVGVQNSSVS